MVLKCLTWIPAMCGQLACPFTKFIEKEPVSSLPDNVTVEILSRLPADCVLEYRRVCRKWRELTSSPYFAELHIKRATTTSPSLFFYWVVWRSFLIYDKACQNKAINWRSIITKVDPSVIYHYKAIIVGSCDGFLMFIATKMKKSVFVFNPITRELVTVPSQCTFTAPCGIYFHPLSREYKLLLCRWTAGNIPRDYYTYSLKSKVWKKLDHTSSCRTRGDPPAILLNGSLHWMVNRNGVNNDKGHVFNSACTDGIMVFGTETEDFQVLPHPGVECYYHPEEHENMRLFGTRDHLCLCHVSWAEMIYVWVLKDYTNWVWDMRYNVSLNWDVKRFPFEHVIHVYIPEFNTKRIKLLGIHNGEIVISWDCRGVYGCNLKQNTVTKLASGVSNLGSAIPFASAYTKSLIRLA
ncbi:hypothetical protein LguiB_006331 [Lonicera macranthoides]